MRRREFITLIGGAAAAWPLAARAQQAPKAPRIGFLIPGRSEPPDAALKTVSGFLRGLQDFCEYARIASIAVDSRLPAIGAAREFADAGGLMSYGVNLPDLARQTATYVEKILKGTKPAELPVEQPTTFEIVLNLKTAQELGLTVSREFQLITDDVIE
jgi:hypothetical protein